MRRLALLVFVQLLLTCAALRVSVVGGSGFVGSRVCQALVAKGAEVTSVSKSGRAPAWAAGEPWAAAVRWAAVDLLRADDAAVDAAMASPEAVVSCVGVVDSDKDVLRSGNGEANVRAFASAKRAGVKRSVYVSVASEVAACETSGWLPFAQDEFSAYFAGKRSAEEAAADAVGADQTKLCVLKPTFIYGGEAFELPLPGRFVAPRVSAGYGSCVEELLSLPLFDALAEATPGLVKVALRPPISVEAVAAACAKGALGELTTDGASRRAVGTLDGTAAIRAASGEQAATPLADGLGRLLERWGQLTETFFEWMQRQLDGPKR